MNRVCGLQGLFLSAAAAALFGVSGCSDPVAGNSMETENSVAFRTIDARGEPIANARVRVRPTWFVADSAAETDTNEFIRNATTDKDGRVKIEGLPAGRFVVEFNGDSLKAVADFAHYDTTEAQELEAAELKPTGTLSGQITLPDNAKNAWVQVYGLDYKVATDSKGAFRLDSLPAGVLRFRAIAYRHTAILGEDLAEVYPARVTDMGTVTLPSVGSEDPSTWKYAQIHYVDSLVSDWMLPLYDSTVITLRLNADNFDFAHAATDGSDIRVQDIYGENLAFARVRYEADLKRAVLRIRIPKTFLGETLILRYGHANAIDRSVNDIWEGIPDSMRFKLSSVTVTDFESNTTGNNRVYFPAPIDTSYWFIAAYPAKSDSSVSKITYENADSGRTGTCAHFTYTHIGNAWSLMGVSFRHGTKSLATLDSIVFWARGTGKISLSFDKNVIDTTDSSYSQTKSWLTFAITAGWTRYAIKPTDLLAADNIGGNVGWKAIKDSITNISFFGSGGAGFYLDDITLYGVDRNDLK